MADPLRIIVFEGDETGQELLDQALRVLDPAVTRVDVALEHHDLVAEPATGDAGVVPLCG